MSIDPAKVLRLNMPQWQGGDQPCYQIGGHVLAALVPPATGPVETVPVNALDAPERTVEQGIRSRTALLAQLHAAQAAIARHDPEAIVTIGGDCLVDLAPIAYLAERYGDDLAVLWVDAHPDVMGPEQYANAHAHVLGNLMGKGDAEFAASVPRPIKPDQILYVGLNNPLPFEAAFLAEHQLAVLSPEAIVDGPGPVIDWLRHRGFKYVAVHFDLDVLDPGHYDFLYFRNPHVARPRSTA